MEKMGHERMYDGQGRKVVKERVGSNMNEFNHFKGMQE
jgi:hypothetical protein